MIYEEYINSDLWKIRRERILLRDGYQCRMCGSGKQLRVHHIRYPAIYGTEPDEDLVTLCDACHRKVHMNDVQGTLRGWAEQIKHRDFIYGGSENMCSLTTLKNSQKDYAEEHKCIINGGSMDVQAALGAAHRKVVVALYEHGFTPDQIYLITPLSKEVIEKYIDNPYVPIKSRLLSETDLIAAASAYVDSVIERRTNEH